MQDILKIFNDKINSKNALYLCKNNTYDSVDINTITENDVLKYNLNNSMEIAIAFLIKNKYTFTYEQIHKIYDQMIYYKSKSYLATTNNIFYEHLVQLVFSTYCMDVNEIDTLIGDVLINQINAQQQILCFKVMKESYHPVNACRYFLSTPQKRAIFSEYEQYYLNNINDSNKLSKYLKNITNHYNFNKNYYNSYNDISKFIYFIVYRHNIQINTEQMQLICSLRFITDVKPLLSYYVGDIEIVINNSLRFSKQNTEIINYIISRKDSLDANLLNKINNIQIIKMLLEKGAVPDKETIYKITEIRSFSTEYILELACKYNIELDADYFTVNVKKFTSQQIEKLMKMKKLIIDKQLFDEMINDLPLETVKTILLNKINIDSSTVKGLSFTSTDHSNKLKMLFEFGLIIDYNSLEHLIIKKINFEDEIIKYIRVSVTDIYNLLNKHMNFNSNLNKHYGIVNEIELCNLCSYSTTKIILKYMINNKIVPDRWCYLQYIKRKKRSGCDINVFMELKCTPFNELIKCKMHPEEYYLLDSLLNKQEELNLCQRYDHITFDQLEELYKKKFD